MGSYVHGSPGASGTAGRMAALVGLSCGSGAPLDGGLAGEARELGDKLAMHVVAMRPPYLSRAAGGALLALTSLARWVLRPVSGW